MKRTAVFASFLAILSIIAGYFLSRASLVGKAGISLFYKQYQFLKVWWQGAFSVFFIWMILLAIQGYVQRKVIKTTANIVHVIALMMALAGLYFTYYDFRHTLSHRMLGERFHLGAYLFWIGWMLICLFYLVERKQKTDYTTSLE